MAIEFISDKTSRLYKAATGTSFDQVLIFGEEVDVSGPITNGRRAALYRGKYNGFVSANDLTPNRSLEVYFIDVGQGDATFIVTPGNKKILVDGGVDHRALGFIAWKYQLWNDQSPTIDIDLLVLTHGDGDHLSGLIPLIQHPKINVKRIVHNGIALFKSGMDERCGNLDPTGDYLTTIHHTVNDIPVGPGIQLSDEFATWRNTIVTRNIPYGRVDVTDGFLDVGDPSITLEVLGPKTSSLNGQNVFKWLGDHAHTINGHSVLLRLTYGATKMFLSGDLNIPGALHLMEDMNLTAKFDAHIFKSPHHGSHEFHFPLLEAIRPQISVISSGDSPDHGHPRANFLAAVGLASRSTAPLLFATEIAATFIDSTEADIHALFPTSTINRTELARAKLFKRTLHGMINVRTDGISLYAARRVMAGYWWESYGPVVAAPRPGIF